MVTNYENNIIGDTYYLFSWQSHAAGRWEDNLNNFILTWRGKEGARIVPNPSEKDSAEEAAKYYITSKKTSFLDIASDKAQTIFSALDKGVKKVVLVAPEETIITAVAQFAKDFEILKHECNWGWNADIKFFTGAINNTLNYKYPLIGFTDDLISWPDFFAYKKIYEINHYTNLVYIKNPKKLFISLNHIPKSHRSLLMDLLYKEGLFDHGFISWPGPDYDHHSRGEYEFKWWIPKKMVVDWDYNKDDPNWCNYFSGNIIPKQYEESLFSLISESNLDSIFLTEKTFNAIISKRPFIIYGHPNTHKYLKEVMGYELFDEVIDYSFDSIDCNIERATMIVQELKKLTKFNLVDLHNLLKPKIEHNYNTMLENVSKRKFITKEIIDVINIDHPYMKFDYRYLINGTGDYI